jgi:hypothetical protein
MLKGAHVGAGSVECSSRPSLARAVNNTTASTRPGSRLGPELVGRRDELAALDDELGRKIHGLLVSRGWAGDDPEFEV